MVVASLVATISYFGSIDFGSVNCDRFTDASSRRRSKCSLVFLRKFGTVYCSLLSVESIDPIMVAADRMTTMMMIEAVARFFFVIMVMFIYASRKTTLYCSLDISETRVCLGRSICNNTTLVFLPPSLGDRGCPHRLYPPTTIL